MSTAGDLLADLDLIGARLEPAGDRLILRAGPTAVPSALVRRVREAKADLLATLAARTDHTVLRSDENRKHGENSPHHQAKDRTFESDVFEWLNQQPAPSTGRCANTPDGDDGKGDAEPDRLPPDRRRLNAASRQLTESRAEAGGINITIDSEFQSLIPPLLPNEFEQLEANICHDGCHEPLSIWNGVLVDGHNRYNICQKRGIKFEITQLEFESRDHAMAWIDERQLGRRNLDDDKRAMVAQDLVERRSRIAVIKQREIARAAKAAERSECAESAHSEEPTGKQKRSKPNRTRTAVAKERNIPDKKLRHAAEIKKADKNVAYMVLAGTVKLTEAKKLVALSESARKTAVEAIASGANVRTAVRVAKKSDYNARIEAAKRKPLEGTYRIIYADPPWKYHGLNQADEYGHAERHYECLDDKQLCDYHPGDGNKTVKELTDDNAVLFMWVTSPLLERCFPIIRAWGFQYKASFVWDKVRHNMGFYNSVRHELLLIATKGSCKPDIPKLVDSVQSIERSAKHSEKPQEFYAIIEAMYDHGRKLELFSRSAREGWDSEGDESDHARKAA
jgi:N6-adenosine-specific RNA methylase IME4